MKIAKEILRLVKERDDARLRVERLEEDAERDRKTLNTVCKLGEEYDPEFRKKAVDRIEAGPHQMSTWDFSKMIGDSRYTRFGIDPPDSEKKDFIFIGMDQAKNRFWETDNEIVPEMVVKLGADRPAGIATEEKAVTQDAMSLDQALRSYRYNLPPQILGRCQSCPSCRREIARSGKCIRLGITIADIRKSWCPKYSGEKV